MWRRIAIAAAIAVAVSGCGGGGGGDAASAPPPPSATTFNADAAFATVFTGGLTVSGLTAADAQGNAFTLSVSIAPTAGASFFGSTQKRALETITVSRAGSAPVSQTAQVFYATTPFQLLGSIAADGTVVRYSPTGSLPTAGTVGSSGPFATFLAFPNASPAALVTGSGASTWSIESDNTPSTAFVCLNSTAGDQATCVRTNPAGVPSGGRLTVTVNGTTLAFR